VDDQVKGLLVKNNAALGELAGMIETKLLIICLHELNEWKCSSMMLIWLLVM